MGSSPVISITVSGPTTKPGVNPALVAAGVLAAGALIVGVAVASQKKEKK